MKTVVICALIKDEHRYLREWIEYNINIGIDKIVLFEDISSKSHSETVSGFDHVELRSVSELAKEKLYINRQITLLKWFAEKYRDEYDYLLAADPDEFLILDGITLNELAEKATGGAVALYYQWIGASGHIDRPEGKLLDVYTSISDHSELWQFKSLIDLSVKCNFKNSHFAGVETVNTLGEKINLSFRKKEFNSTKTFEGAYIKHFVTKSWADWTERLQRGNITDNYRNGDTFFVFNEDLKEQRARLVDYLSEIDTPTATIKSIFGTNEDTSASKFLDEMNAPLPEGVSPEPEMNVIFAIHNKADD
jgi:hypothetical protein